jgi:hypothetical protein
MNQLMWKSLTNPEFWKKNPLSWIMLGGLVIKLVVMPITAHADLLLTYGRSAQIAFFDMSPFWQTQFLPHFLQAVWLKLWSFVVGVDFFMPATIRLGELTNSQLMHKFLAENPDPNLTIFVFKLLYLLIDIAVAYGLYHFFLRDKPKRAQILGFALYWLNPLIIFSVFMFGRYEVLVAGLMLLLVWQVKKSYYLWAILSVGLLIASRPSMILVVPVFILILPFSWWKRGVAAVATLIPIAITFLLKPASQAATQLEWLSAGQHSDYIFQGLVLNDIQTEIYLFWFVFMAFLVWFWQKRFALSTHLTLAAGLAITFGIYYATSFYHPQYLVWGLMPLIVFVVETYEQIPLRHLLKVCGLIVLALPLQLLTWRQDILMGIFLPLSPVIGEKDLSGVINNFFDVKDLSNLGWTLASVAWFYVIYIVWTYLRANSQND